MGRLIEVDENYFKTIERDSEFLTCLTTCGVDKWDGFEEALSMYSEYFKWEGKEEREE